MTPHKQNSQSQTKAQRTQMDLYRKRSWLSSKREQVVEPVVWAVQNQKEAESIVGNLQPSCLFYSTELNSQHLILRIWIPKQSSPYNIVTHFLFVQRICEVVIIVMYFDVLLLWSSWCSRSNELNYMLQNTIWYS